MNVPPVISPELPPEDQVLQPEQAEQVGEAAVAAGELDSFRPADRVHAKEEEELFDEMHRLELQREIVRSRYFGAFDYSELAPQDKLLVLFDSEQRGEHRVYNGELFGLVHVQDDESGRLQRRVELRRELELPTGEVLGRGTKVTLEGVAATDTETGQIYAADEGSIVQGRNLAVFVEEKGEVVNVGCVEVASVNNKPVFKQT